MIQAGYLLRTNCTNLYGEDVFAHTYFTVRVTGPLPATKLPAATVPPAYSPRTNSPPLSSPR